MAPCNAIFDIEMPELKDNHTPRDIEIWLGCCEDVIESAIYYNDGKDVEPQDVRHFIREAGQMMNGEAREWYGENRFMLKRLSS